MTSFARRTIIVATLAMPVLALTLFSPSPFGAPSFGGSSSDGFVPGDAGSAQIAPAMAYADPLPAPLARKSVAPAAVSAADAVGVAAAGGRGTAIWLGTAMLDRLTGDVAVGARGAEPVYSASLSKLVVVIDILDRRRVEGLTVTESDLRLIRRALGPSDDGAMSALWGRFDGSGTARRMSARLGLTATTPARDPTQWGEMMISAQDLVTMYRHVLETMPAEDRELLFGSLPATTGEPVRGADGFDQGYGLLGPDSGVGSAVAKQAWMCCHRQQFTLHSAGLVSGPYARSTLDGPRFVLVLLSKQPKGGGWTAATQRLTQAAAAARLTMS